MIDLVMDFLGQAEPTFTTELSASMLLLILILIIFNTVCGILQNIFR